MERKASAVRAAAAAKAAGIAALCGAMLMFSQSSRDGVTQGLELCMRVLVPSLFPFMAAANLAVKCGICHRLGKPLSPLMKRLFGLSGAFAPIILLSLIGGYPVGARGISQLKQSGAVSEAEAKKAALFTVCAGPGFLINFIGISIYQNEKIGLIMLGAQILSVLILGICVNLFDKSKKNFDSDKELKPPAVPFGTALVEAARDTAGGMAAICSLVLLFSAVSAVCAQLIPNEKAVTALSTALEVCSAVGMLSEGFPLEFLAFAVGFGGLCVHFQIFAALGDIKVNKALFFFIRMIQGLLTAVFTRLGVHLFLKEAAVFSSGQIERAGVFGGSMVSAVALMTVSVCFLFTLKNDYRR